MSNYIENNVSHIDYATYINKGYTIGSGAVESSNKYVLQNRLKQPGMRWNRYSAQSLVDLRSKMESNKWFNDVIIPVKKYYGIIE
jgi:hypothetical protein